MALRITATLALAGAPPAGFALATALAGGTVAEDTADEPICARSQLHDACPCEPAGCSASSRSVAGVTLLPVMCVLAAASTIVGNGRHSDTAAAIGTGVATLPCLRSNGSYTLRARYDGDDSHALSISSPYSQTVATSTALRASSPEWNVLTS